MRTHRVIATTLIVGLFAIAACDRFKKHPDAGANSSSSSSGTSTDDSGATASADDASSDAASAPAAANEKDVKRFPDEEVLVETVQVQWPTVVARTEPGAGNVVATLPKGASVTVGARKGKSVLGIFQDPKDATKTLMGWIAEDAFTPGTSPPPVLTLHTDGGTPPKPSGVCPAGLTLLFDQEPFCGKVCKANTDCTAPQVCASGPKLITASGTQGATVMACRRALANATISDAGVITVTTSDGGTRIITNPFRPGRIGGVK
jgi:hypothetical protein